MFRKIERFYRDRARRYSTGEVRSNIEFYHDLCCLLDSADDVPFHKEVKKHLTITLMLFETSDRDRFYTHFDNLTDILREIYTTSGPLRGARHGAVTSGLMLLVQSALHNHPQCVISHNNVEDRSCAVLFGFEVPDYSGGECRHYNPMLFPPLDRGGRHRTRFNERAERPRMPTINTAALQQEYSVDDRALGAFMPDHRHDDIVSNPFENVFATTGSTAVQGTITYDTLLPVLSSQAYTLVQYQKIISICQEQIEIIRESQNEEND